MEKLKELGQKLRTTRELKQKSSYEVSEYLRITKTELEIFESGELNTERQNFYNRLLLKKYIEYLDLPYEEFYDVINEYYPNKAGATKMGVPETESFIVTNNSIYRKRFLEFIKIFLIVIVVGVVVYLLSSNLYKILNDNSKDDLDINEIIEVSEVVSEETSEQADKSETSENSENDPASQKSSIASEGYTNNVSKYNVSKKDFKLKIEATQRTYVEVYVNNENVMLETIEATTRTFDVKDLNNLTIFTGNSAGLKIYIDDEEVVKSDNLDTVTTFEFNYKQN